MQDLRRITDMKPGMAPEKRKGMRENHVYQGTASGHFKESACG